MAGRGRKSLSTEDRILWSKVARSARALPGRMDEIESFEKTIAEADAEREKPVVKAAASALRKAAAEAAYDDMSYQAPPQPRPPARPQPLERPVKRKLAKGRLELDARIDLHGMFQDEAHALLLAFLRRAHERGMRHVLVITGKGSSMGSEGALKRAVPIWFAQPDFRHLISSWEAAAQKHGGEGALYVRLARIRGSEP